MSTTAPTPPALYGLLAEFDTATGIVEAAQKAHEAGFTKIDAFSPYPLMELIDVMKLHRTRLPWIVFGGGLLGFAAGMGLEVWASAIAYPLNIGGRPYISLPSFIVPSYETTILFAAISAVVGMIALNGLPRPYHPVFNVPAFSMASSERFFLCIETADPRFDHVQTRAFLESLHPVLVYDVPE
jgi:Alternative complex III, ActD subunit